MASFTNYLMREALLGFSSHIFRSHGSKSRENAVSGCRGSRKGRDGQVKLINRHGGGTGIKMKQESKEKQDRNSLS